MDKYLDSGPSSSAAGQDRVPIKRSAASTKSRLSALLSKPKVKPAEGFDVSVIGGLSVGDGAGAAAAAAPAAKRARRSSRGSGDGGGGSGAAVGSRAECLDVTASPQRGAARSAASGSSNGGSSGGVCDDFGARFSGRKNNNSSSRGGSSTVGGRASSYSSGWLTTSTGGGGSNGGGARSSSGSKMGPWARRPGEVALCAEEGYDPLELMDDANREIFGNNGFRGVQERVSAWCPRCRQ